MFPGLFTIILILQGYNKKMHKHYRGKRDIKRGVSIVGAEQRHAGCPRVQILHVAWWRPVDRLENSWPGVHRSFWNCLVGQRPTLAHLWFACRAIREPRRDVCLNTPLLQFMWRGCVPSQFKILLFWRGGHVLLLAGLLYNCIHIVYIIYAITFTYWLLRVTDLDFD
jgi:hypothetical protein